MATSDEMAALLAKPYHAVLATTRASGAPQLSIVWFLWDGEAFFFSTMKTRAKYVNLSRDPAVSLLVNDAEHAWYVVAYGNAEIVEHGHPELARALFAKYLPGQDAGAVADDPLRVAVRMRPRRLLTGR